MGDAAIDMGSPIISGQDGIPRKAEAKVVIITTMSSQAI